MSEEFPNASLRSDVGAGAGAAPVGVTSAKGLLITADPMLARAFLRELQRCSDCPAAFDVRSSLTEAAELAGERHRLVAVDLAGVPPTDTVGLARRFWPSARIAVLSCWWSDQDGAARELADAVIHKPLRSSELLAFLRNEPVPRQTVALPAASARSSLRSVG